MNSAAVQRGAANAQKKFSAAVSHYFDLAKMENIDQHMTDEKAGDMPQIVKMLIKGRETDFEHATLLAVRDRLNKITKNNVKSTLIDLVTYINTISDLDSPYKKIFLFKSVFDEIIDKACMEKNFIDAYVDLLFGLQDRCAARKVESANIARPFVEVLDAFLELGNDDLFPDMKDFRKYIMDRKDRLSEVKAVLQQREKKKEGDADKEPEGDGPGLKGLFVAFFREYMLRSNMAEEIKTGQTHNPAFNIAADDSTEAKAIKEQNKLVHLTNNVKFLTSIFTKDLVNLYKRAKRSDGKASAAGARSAQRNLFLPITQFVTLMSYLMRRQFDKTIDNFYAQKECTVPENRREREVQSLKDKVRDGFPKKNTLTIDDVDKKKQAYKALLRNLEHFMVDKYKASWSSEYMELVVIILGSGGFTMDGYDRSSYEYALYIYCVDVLKLLISKKMLEVRIQVLFSEIFDDRDNNWVKARAGFNYELGPVKPSSPERGVDSDDVLNEVRENGLRYTIASRLGFLDADINNKKADIFGSPEILEKCYEYLTGITARMAFKNLIHIVYDDLPSLFTSRTEDEINTFYKKFAEGLVRSYTKPKDAKEMQINDTIVTTLGRILLNKKIRFPALFPDARRVDDKDISKGFKDKISELQYNLAIAVFRNCIHRAVSGALDDNEYGLSEESIGLVKSKYAILFSDKASDGSWSQNKECTTRQTTSRIVPPEDVVAVFKAEKAGLFSEPDADGNEEHIVDFLEKSALVAVGNILFQTNYPDINFANVKMGTSVYNSLLSLVKMDDADKKSKDKGKEPRRDAKTLHSFLIEDLQFPTSVCFLACAEIDADLKVLKTYAKKDQANNPLVVGKMGDILLTVLFGKFCERYKTAVAISVHELGEYLATQPVLRVKSVILSAMKTAALTTQYSNDVMRLMTAAVVSRGLMSIQDFRDVVESDKKRRYGKTFGQFEPFVEWVSGVTDEAIAKLSQQGIEKQIPQEKGPAPGVQQPDSKPKYQLSITTGRDRLQEKQDSKESGNNRGRRDNSYGDNSTATNRCDESRARGSSPSNRNRDGRGGAQGRYNSSKGGRGGRGGDNSSGGIDFSFRKQQPQ